MLEGQRTKVAKSPEGDSSIWLIAGQLALAHSAAMRSLISLPNQLGPFMRSHLGPLAPNSGKRGVAAVYLAESFSGVVATWRPMGADGVIPDGIGSHVTRQFIADLEHIANTEATSAPVQRVAWLRTATVQVPMLEARYLIDGVADEPAFATLAAFGVARTYVSLATTVAGPNTWRTSNRRDFYRTLAEAWAETIAESRVALSLRCMSDLFGTGWVERGMTDLDDWQELRSA